MIAQATLALLLSAAGGAASTPPRDSWFGADKLKHFFVAAFAQSVAYSALQAARVRHDRALAGAWAATAAASVGKELYDRRTSGSFSVRDLVWDAAGAGVATVLIDRAERRGSAEAERVAGGASRSLTRAAWRRPTPRR
jgi:putative lipoprotein